MQLGDGDVDVLQRQQVDRQQPCGVDRGELDGGGVEGAQGRDADLGGELVERGATGGIGVDHLGVDAVEVHVGEPLFRVPLAGPPRCRELLARGRLRARTEGRWRGRVGGTHAGSPMRAAEAEIRVVVLARQVCEHVLVEHEHVGVGGDRAIDHGQTSRAEALYVPAVWTGST